MEDRIVTCPVCATDCRVISGTEGTNHYKSISDSELRVTCATLREQAEIGKGMLGEAMGIIGELNTRIALAEKVVETARLVAPELRELVDSGEFKGIFIFAHTHGMEYNGPEIERRALEELEAALSAYKPDAG